jgi:hypothetical protein
MTGVGVVVPVVMVGEIIALALTRVAEKVGLAGVVEVVIGMSNVVGFFGIKRAVALVLVCITACHTVEDVAVMYPYVVVVLLKADTVTLVTVAVHKADVSYLKVGYTLDSDTKAVEYGVLADTLNGHTAGKFSFAEVDKQVTLIKCCGVGNVADKSYADRLGFVSFLRAVRMF